MKRNSQRGVALVITLMMLAIITILVVVFLGLARRNRAGVALRGSQTEAQYAAEYALQRAKADMVGQIMFTNNLLGFDLAVSHGLERPPFTGPVPLRDPAGNLTGPVLIDTNRNGTKGPPESRSYLDLNRNREFEQTLTDTNQVGDPEWIYMLDKPDQPYGPNNQFVARYAYLALPAGKALDVNSIHNLSTNGNALYNRNQGVGAFELNLAAFLYETDTNIWPYVYDPFAAPSPLTTGQAFWDATNFVYYRTTAPGVPRFTLGDLFGGKSTSLTMNGVDDLGDDRPAGIFFSYERPTEPRDVINKPYPAAEALRHYFTPQDFFDPLKTSAVFTNNLFKVLRNAPGITNGYKFYDLISVLGTDTGNESRGRINLNWANVGGYTIDTLTPWDTTNGNLPLVFFTNAAQRILTSMIKDFFPVTNVNAIEIWPTNYYDNSVHRVMQQAANILDASLTNEFPNVFRPIFGFLPAPHPSTNFYIIGWTNDNSVSTLGNYLRDNTNGIPLVVGAKKGLPNFNEYTYRTDTLVTRKLQLTRPDKDSLPKMTNQMYFMGLSNSFSVESWNSYATRFAHASIVEISNTVTIVMTNLGGIQYSNTLAFYSNPFRTNTPANWSSTIDYDKGFKLTMLTNVIVISNAVYHFGNNRFEQISTNQFEVRPANPFQLPYWNMTISNRLVYIHSIGDAIIDFVVISDIVTNDTSTILQNARSPATLVGNVWDTNRFRSPLGPTEGIRAQLTFSQLAPASSDDWRPFSDVAGDVKRAVQNFNDFLLAKTNAPLAVETPFNPMARTATITTWQANDPLVHYHAGDLLAYAKTVTKSLTRTEDITASDNPSSLTNYNKAYRPWKSIGTVTTSAEGSSDPLISDPGVSSSDDWDFPYHQYPSVGWLGKVHRGTPWQTVYLKAGAASLDTWRQYANNVRSNAPGLSLGQYIVCNHPTNDYRLIDIFTAALTDNAARGLLSINQPRLAAWSAAMAGMVVVTNVLNDDDVADPQKRAQTQLDKRYEPIVIQPSGGNTNSPLWVIWDAVQKKRQTLRGATFNDFSELLAIPELTTRSPFLNYLPPNQVLHGLDDYAYERIPQQILGLLRIGEPRFVIYAYGQALKPEHVNTSSGTTDNYQITAEFATRSVMRVEGTPQKPKVIMETFNILPPD